MMQQIEVQSYAGPYRVYFVEDPFVALTESQSIQAHYLVDSRVAELYSGKLGPILENRSCVFIEATEKAKSLAFLGEYIETLVENGIQRDHTLIAVGGGVIQDITCFLASTLFRGMNWEFIPTTLLAQADSCIGSKSSINVSGIKNLVGTFCPPRRIYIAHEFIETLTPSEFCSGVGEIIKAHIIGGQHDFNRLAASRGELASDRGVLKEMVFQSLQIKKLLVEEDEFDRGRRAIMNYGHSFGHAIEAATDFATPHGIAVTIGMDIANYCAYTLGRITRGDYERMSVVLRENAGGYLHAQMELEHFYSALQKDKKNTGDDLTLILLNSSLAVEKVRVKYDEVFRRMCETYFRRNQAA